MAKRKQAADGQPQIKFDRHNFRTHNDDNKRMIHDSLAELGAGRSVVVDKENELIAGNGVYEQAQKLGMPVRIIETDGSELVVVKRTDLATDDMKRKKLAAADNAISDNVTWNVEEIRANLDETTIEALHIDLPAVGIEEQAEEIERKRKEFEDRMAAGELSEDDEEYQEFLHKFDAKKTTDDCYTPEIVYNAVADWVAQEYGLSRANFVRPFYPGGDYQCEKYKSTDVVVDNPPFSILAQILQWYNEHGVRYFLFAPHLTLFGSARSRGTALCIDVPVTYANGANVSTSFVTNMEAGVLFRSAPSLYSVVKAANDENLKSMRVELPKYNYPMHLITTPVVARFSKYGIDFVVRQDEAAFVGALDVMKEYGRSIFGSGYLLSDTKKAEREKAEREKAEREKAEREKAEREKAEREKAFVFELSEREREIIDNLK